MLSAYRVHPTTQADLPVGADFPLEGKSRQVVIDPLDVEEGQLQLRLIETAWSEQFRVCYQRWMASTITSPGREFVVVDVAFPVESYRMEAVSLATLLLHTVRTKKATYKELGKLFAQHPDHGVFASLPGVGALLAPALLVKFGDDRDRFPSPAGVQALTGTCPVTKQSGKYKYVQFRKACDRDFRYISQQWALRSLAVSVWANTYLQRARSRGHSKSHTLRCLANRWLAVAWKLWQTRQLYDEEYHLRQRAKRRKPK